MTTIKIKDSEIERDREVRVVFITNVYGREQDEIRSAQEMKRLIEVGFHKEIEGYRFKDSILHRGRKTLTGKLKKIVRQDRNSRQKRGEV